MLTTGHPTALLFELPQTETFDEWRNLGRKLCAGMRAINFLVGDWLLDGSTRFGDDARDEAVAIFRTDVERFGPIVDVCRRFPEPKRHAALTFGHHLAVMTVEDDDQAQAMLARAEQSRMTVSALKAEVRVSTNRQTTLLVDDDPDWSGSIRIGQAWNRESQGSRDLFLGRQREVGLGVIEQ